MGLGVTVARRQTNNLIISLSYYLNIIFVKIFYSFDPLNCHFLTIFRATKILAANIAATRELRKPLISLLLHCAKNCVSPKFAISSHLVRKTSRGVQETSPDLVETSSHLI